MIEIVLKRFSNNLFIDDYRVYYPFTLNVDRKYSKKIYWNVASLSCPKAQGSFKIYFARVLDASNIKDAGEYMVIPGGRIDIRKPISQRVSQFFRFQKHLLFYAEEGNPSSYINDKKSLLPSFLINSGNNIKNSVRFWIEYDNDIPLVDEEFRIVLNLEYVED